MEEEIKNEEPKQKSHKVFAIVIIVIACALIFGSGIILGQKLFEENKENKNTSKDTNTVVDNDDVKDNTNIRTIRVYDTSDHSTVFSFNNNVYIIDGLPGSKEYDLAIDKLVNEENKILFENNYYSEQYDEDINITIIKIDLTIDEVNKIYDIYIDHDYNFNDATDIAYFIMRDGTVKKIDNHIVFNGGNFGTIIDAKEFKDYKIKKILSFSCENYNNDSLTSTCDSIKANFILIDGTYKTIII